MAGIDEVEKLPVGQTPVNRPGSGTYGEKASLENLQSALPTGDGPASMPSPGGPPGMAPTNPIRSARESSIPGVPAPLMKPLPEQTPSGVDMAPATPSPQALTGAQHRLQILDMLSSSPHVSETTREWASRVMDILVS